MVDFGKALFVVFGFAFFGVEALVPGGVNVCTYKSSQRTSTSTSCGLFGWSRCTSHYTRYWTSYKCCAGYHSRDNTNCDYADSCGHPGDITNGYRSGSSYSYASTVYYYCNTNYQLVGSSSRQCQKDGTWSGNLPSCKLVNACYSDPCKNGATCSNVDSTYSCVCSPGWSGFNCDKANPCGHPGNITNGYIEGFTFTYGSSVRYVCNKHHNLTGGNGQRTCQANGIWNGTKPSCIFTNKCQMLKPCKNNGTCIDGLNDYKCTCSGSWSGLHCEEDMHPPDISACPKDMLYHSEKPQQLVEWTIPSFEDRFGSNLTVTSNYKEPRFVFPWGEHIVSYIALKTSNGQRSECKFKIVVQPHQCAELNIPEHGAKVCSDWKTEYGKLCLVYCQKNYRLRRGIDHRQWYVCGSSGSWRASGPLPNCTEKAFSYLQGVNEVISDFFFESCHDETSLNDMKISFLNRVDASQFSFFCRHFRNQCNKENVSVQCNIGYILYLILYLFVFATMFTMLLILKIGI